MPSVARGTVLVVEDDPVIAKLLQVNFEIDGYDVITAEDGDEGLRRARQTYPDVVVLDVVLPGINGLDVAHRLRAGNDTWTIPIILLSALAQASDVAAGSRVADRYVTKPFDPLGLLDLVAGILHARLANRN